MRSECVKGPFVTALPMTLSGIAKGINTLRARDCQSFSFFHVFFYRGHRHRRSGRKTKRRNPFNRPPDVFIHFSRSFVVFCTHFIARPLHQSFEKLRDRALHCWQYVWSCFLATVRESFFSTGFQVIHFQTVIKQIWKHID